MRNVLGAEFFARPSPIVARELVGKYLVCVVDGEEVSLMLNEVEAYAGPQDLGSHARFGQTLRTAPLFGPPGTIYIYFTYGMHYMLNLVCRKAGEPSAVLVRGAGHVVGPGRLTKALKIDKRYNAKLLGKATGLWVEDRGVVVRPGKIQKTPRIGIDYAGAWVGKPWRFVLAEPNTKKKKK